MNELTLEADSMFETVTALIERGAVNVNDKFTDFFDGLGRDKWDGVYTPDINSSIALKVSDSLVVFFDFVDELVEPLFGVSEISDTDVKEYVLLGDRYFYYGSRLDSMPCTDYLFYEDVIAFCNFLYYQF